MTSRLMVPPLAAATSLLSLMVYILFNLPRFETDVQASWSGVTPDEAQLAARILATDNQFSVGPVGPAGAMTIQQVAWRRLLRRPDAEELFVRLTREGRPGSLLWGLAGLRLLQSPAYGIHAARFRASRWFVVYSYGCVPSSTTVGDFVAALDTVPSFAYQLLGNEWVRHIGRRAT